MENTNSGTRVGYFATSDNLTMPFKTEVPNVLY